MANVLRDPQGNVLLEREEPNLALVPLATEETDGLMSAQDKRKLDTMDGGGTEVVWGDITEKPETFPPSAHNHTITDVTGLEDALQNAGSVKSVNGQTPDDNGNVTVETSGAGGYVRTVVNTDTEALAGRWYICTADLTLTLPSAVSAAFVRVSTVGTAETVMLLPAEGESIDGDAEGLTIDKTHGTTELIGIGSGWTVIEAK